MEQEVNWGSPGQRDHMVNLVQWAQKDVMENQELPVTRDPLAKQAYLVQLGCQVCKVCQGRMEKLVDQV